MKVGKAVVSCALAALAGGCSVEPAVPLASVRVRPPIVVSPVPAAPILVEPAFHRPRPGRGWGRHKHGRHHHD